ncbi:MAG TPA: CHASE2 domain-containing protein [Pyrinomonadaceae bacterium]|nr:CHASE2 domain-containing protein [Pyrinomonadaceae bacterium]
MSRKRTKAKSSQTAAKAPVRKQPGPAEVTLKRRLLRAAPALVILIFITVLLSRFGTLHDLETAFLDMQLRLSSAPERSDVAIVNITDDDFKKLFGGERPLNPQLLSQLIEAIAKGGPAVIGVDIDTSAEKFKDFRFGQGWPPIVWEREVKELPENIEAKEKPEPIDVLGGQDPALNASSGLPLLIEDGEDKVTRRYRRFIENARDPNEPWPSFAWAVVSRYGRIPGGPVEPFRDRFIGFAGDREGSHRINIPAAAVLEQSKSWTKDQSPLSRKIVLLGGSYGEDWHETPLGRMQGVDILAYVLETELRGGGAAVPPKYIFYVLEILSGFSIVILFHAVRFSRALLLSLVAAPLLALVCGLVAFRSFSGWAFFAPLLFGLVLYEAFVEYRNHVLVEKYAEIRGETPDKHG